MNPGRVVAPRKLEAEQLPEEAAYSQLHLYGPSSGEGRGRRQARAGGPVLQSVLKVGRVRENPCPVGGRPAWLLPWSSALYESLALLEP